MAFANPPLMVLMESPRTLVAGGDRVSLLGLFPMGDVILVSSSSSSSSSTLLPNHIDFWLAGWLAG